MTKRMITTAVGAALLLTAAHQARAGERTWRVGRDLVIRGEGLDLNRAAERERLLLRVQTAAAAQCGGAGVRNARRACEAEVLGQAMATAPAPVRTALTLALSAQSGTTLAAR